MELDKAYGVSENAAMKFLGLKEAKFNSIPELNLASFRIKRSQIQFWKKGNGRRGKGKI